MTVFPARIDYPQSESDPINALQIKVGVDNSDDPNSLDYKVRTGGGLVVPTNDQLAGTLINATSPGDVGGWSTHFLGSATNTLPDGWTDPFGSPVCLLGNSVLSLGEGTIAAHAYTPSGAFTIDGRFLTHNAELDFDLVDSTFTNFLELTWQGPIGGSPANNLVAQYSIDGGTDWTVVQAQPGDASPEQSIPTFAGMWHYRRISRDADGNIFFFYSFDRINWVEMTDTPLTSEEFAIDIAYVAFGGGGGPEKHSCDFIDVVA